MSTPARQRDHAAPRLAARRSAAGRSRRADDGTLTEMARSLLRDARYSRAGEHEHAGGSARLEQRSQLRPGADLQRAEQAVMSTDLLGAPDPAAEAA